jgi:hypothetical protein
VVVAPLVVDGVVPLLDLLLLPQAAATTATPTAIAPSHLLE